MRSSPEDQVIEAIHREVARLGTLKAVAKDYAVSYCHLAAVARGIRPPGPRVRMLFLKPRRRRPRGIRAPRLASHEKLRQVLETMVLDHGGCVRSAARELGLDERSIGDVLRGTYQIGNKLAAAMGYKRVQMYERTVLDSGESWD